MYRSEKFLNISKGAIRMRNKQKGFSLIELLIVVAIILIIAAIAIPNLLRSKMAANEASAVASLRTLNTSIVAYSTTYGNDPATLPSLGCPTGCTVGATTADLIDSVLASGIKSGYTITYVAGAVPISTYTIVATPTSAATGLRNFFTDQSCVIRSNTTGFGGAAPTVASTPIG